MPAKNTVGRAKFAREIAEGASGAEAVRRAGFNTKYPEKVAHNLKQDPEIQGLIEKEEVRLSDALHNQNLGTARVVAELERVLNATKQTKHGEMPDWPVIMKAIQELNRLHGNYAPEKKEVKSLNMTVTEQMVQEMLGKN